MVNYFPLASSIVAACFAGLIGYQYLRRRKRHQLVWTVSLSLFFLTTLFEFLAEPEIWGWNVPMYKAYYAFTSPMVALMGVGVLFLLTHKPWGKWFLWYTTAVSIGLFAAVIIAPVTQADIDAQVAEQGSSEIAGLAMPSYVRNFSPLLTIPGGSVLIGGALYSYWLDRSRKYNLLLAIGGAFPFAGGALARFGQTVFFYSFEFVGTLLLFMGFLLSMEYIKAKAAQAEKRPTLGSA